MVLAPSLIVPTQLLEIAYQSAALIHLGRGRELSDALRDQRTDPPPLEALAQVETLRGVVARDSSLLETLQDTLSYLRERASNYRSSSRPFERLEVIARMEMVGIPGGLFVMGNHRFGPPRWVRLSPFRIGWTAVTNGQYRYWWDSFKKGRTGYGESFRVEPEDDLLSGVDSENLERFPARLSRESGEDFRLPTGAEREYAARGPAVPLRELMEEEVGKFRPRDFENFIGGRTESGRRFENFFTELGGRIFNDEREPEFQRILKTAIPIYGYRMFATPTGRMTDRGEPYPDNAFGLKQMMGGVWELNQDQMIRGGDYLTNDPRELMAASYFPIRETTVPHERIGFRLALSL